MDPPVSDPMASGAMPAATAAALPPLEPPGTRVGSCGLRVGPNAEFSVDDPIANSSRLVLPTITAPAPTRRSTTVASYGGSQPSRIFDEQVVGTPRVHMLSLRATGTPASGPGSSPRASRPSRASAAARASSAITWLNACSSGSRAPMALSASSTTWRAVRLPSRTARAMSTAVSMVPLGSFPQDAGYAEPVVLGRRCLCQHLVAVEAGLDLVGAQDVLERQRVGGGRHVGSVELLDVGGVVEHGAELGGEHLELVVGHGQARQAGHVRDGLTGEALRHSYLSSPTTMLGLLSPTTMVRPSPCGRTRRRAPRSRPCRSRWWPRDSCGRD